MIKKFRQKIKNHFEEISKSEQSLHSIALGFAVGTFIAITPSLGLDLLIGLLVVLIFKNLNKFSVFGAMIVWNPLTLIPIHYLSFKIGDLLFGGSNFLNYNVYALSNFYVYMLSNFYEFSKRYLIGNLILAVFFSVLGYFVSIAVVKWYRKRSLKKGLTVKIK